MSVKNNREPKFQIGDRVYTHFENADGTSHVVHGVVADIKFVGIKVLIAADWEKLGLLESSLYYNQEYIHLVERKEQDG